MTMVKLVSLKLYCILIAASLFLPNCKSKTVEIKQSPFFNLEASRLLTKNDSVAIDNCIHSVVRSDTQMSKTNCSQLINYYNLGNKIMLSKSFQFCLSDTRVVWNIETYFDQEGTKLLSVYFNGLSAMVNVKRF
jgi:hypothetical protein